MGRPGETVRVPRSAKLADQDREHGTATCEAVRLLRQKELTKVSTAPAVTTEDMKVVDSWETQYLPYCEKEWKGEGHRDACLNRAWFQTGLAATPEKSLRHDHAAKIHGGCGAAILSRCFANYPSSVCKIEHFSGTDCDMIY
jgi:hypothetical protein